MAEQKKKPKNNKKTVPKAPAAIWDDEGMNQQLSVLMFAAAVLILLLALVKGSSGWLWMHDALKGVFGVTLLVIPFGLCYLAVMLDKEEKKPTLLRRLFYGLLAASFFSGFVEIMFGGGRLQDYSSLWAAVKMLFEDGKGWSSGGVLSAVVAFPMLHLFGDVGSKILICLLLFVTMMWMTKKSLSELFAVIRAPFCRLADLWRESRETESAIRRYEAEQARLAQEEEDEEEDAPGFFSEIVQKLKRRNSDASVPELDIPLQETGTGEEMPIEREPEKPKRTKKNEVQESMPQKEEKDDPALEELIRQATEKPRKKTKEEVKQETVDAIAEEIAQQPETVPAAAYTPPSLDFLKSGQSHADDPNASRELREKADLLTSVLQSFNVSARITHIARGPSVIRYEVQPAAGVKVSKITSLADDIALNLAAEGVRIEAPIPGKPAVGIEVPNSCKDIVSLREILESKKFQESKSRLSFAVGRDIAGSIIIGDVAKMPHMIIAGATGSGKSVCTNSIIMSILYHASPSEVKLILIDPKIVEFRIYDGIPHLLIPVVTDPKKAAGALNWAVQEMLGRYNTFAENGVRDLGDYNRLCLTRSDLAPMPQIVIAIDELADLMMASSKEVEDAICRLAQMARAAGMHLIIATQRPTTDIITGLIKANIPSRIALTVKSSIDSRTILDQSGAEKLLGHGDMLYMPSGQPKPVRVQGCFVSTEEIDRVVSFIKQGASSEYDESIMQAVDEITASSQEKNASSSSEETPQQDGDGDILEKAIEVVVYAGQASTSNLQRRLRLGYARAARIMDELEEMGIIGPYEGAKPRRVLLTREQYEERKLRSVK